MAHVGDLAHDREPRPTRSAKINSVADRILARPESLRHRLVNRDRSGCINRILVSEFASSQNANAQAAEVTGTGHAVIGARPIRCTGIRTSLNHKAATSSAIEGQMRNGTHGDHTRNWCNESGKVLAEARDSGWPVVEILLGQRDRHREDVLRIEAQLNP